MMIVRLALTFRQPSEPPDGWCLDTGSCEWSEPATKGWSFSGWQKGIKVATTRLIREKNRTLEDRDLSLGSG